MIKMNIATVAAAACFFAYMIWFGPTFGNRCAAYYPDKSVGWEACVLRLANGDGIHFIRRVELIPIE